jgi:hypothetical protein
VVSRVEESSDLAQGHGHIFCRTFAVIVLIRLRVFFGVRKVSDQQKENPVFLDFQCFPVLGKLLISKRSIQFS